MTTDNKTLADVQPGGRVRLGDALLPCPFCGAPAERIDFGIGSGEDEGGSCVACTGCQSSGPVEFGYKENFISNWNRRALSAQPSLGGQGDALHDAVGRIFGCDGSPWRTRDVAAVLRDYAALAARQPVEAAPQGCDACDRTGIRQHDEGRNICCPDCDLGRACAGNTRQPVGEPITVEAMATVRRNGGGDRYIDWLTEGGIADLEVGDVLMVSNRAITDEDGSGEVYATPAQAVDLGPLRVLADHATGRINHANNGQCPDQVEGHDTRDPYCAVCRALIDSQVEGK